MKHFSVYWQVFFLECIQRGEIDGSWNVHIFNFSVNTKLFPKVFLPIYPPTSNERIAHCSPHPHQYLAFSDFYFLPIY